MEPVLAFGQYAACPDPLEMLGAKHRSWNRYISRLKRDEDRRTADNGKEESAGIDRR